eukprot:TRINITY_DN87235_c0_g1_i1.p1 TRINITY_DN87235_c0_g1~~TRINITY_DN87235_c0_g1_i1.p1  ORF type:complete len:358 (-),score=77.69 TRINITY_DN87235_c0_g1_i1:187-1260(-)
MGRGSGPQGGAGNQGGALSSKSSKPRKPKNVVNISKKGAVEESQPDTESDSSPAYSVVRPPSQQRTDLMQARRKDKALATQLAVRAAAAAAAARQPVNGTTAAGSVLGGSCAQPEDLRQARLQHLAQQHDDGSFEKVAQETPATSQQTVSHGYPSLISISEREALALSIAELPDLELRDYVAVLLDMLEERLRQGGIGDSVRVLCTVLENAATKVDLKYRRLKAQNDKLWFAVLQHPELCAVIEVVGFVLQHDAQAQVINQQIEVERIRSQLHTQLDSSVTPDQTAVESLLVRLERLETATSFAEVPAVSAAEKRPAERNATYLHGGGEDVTDLVVALESASDWLHKYLKRSAETSD